MSRSSRRRRPGRRAAWFSLRVPGYPEGELHGGDEAEVKGVMVSARGPLGSGG
ncbi:MAG: hypothetical protein RXP86_10380 [Acidilobus sp.]